MLKKDFPYSRAWVLGIGAGLLLGAISLIDFEKFNLRHFCESESGSQQTKWEELVCNSLVRK